LEDKTIIIKKGVLNDRKSQNMKAWADKILILYPKNVEFIDKMKNGFII
jgi:hypothetical protein